MRIHVLQHVAYETPAQIGRWAEARGHRLDVSHPYAGEPLPAANAAEPVLTLGGPVSADDDERHPWLAAERRLLQTVLAQGGRVFGICLGAQLLAQALGARVRRQADREIGWLPVVRAAPGAGLPLLAGVPERWTVFQWHGDAFDLPAGGTALFASAACATQGFVAAGGRALGLQFHPEVDTAAVQAMLAHDGAELALSGPYVQARDELERGAAAGAAAAYPLLCGLLDRFLDR